jgi:hypothetical protein
MHRARTAALSAMMLTDPCSGWRRLRSSAAHDLGATEVCAQKLFKECGAGAACLFSCCTSCVATLSARTDQVQAAFAQALRGFKLISDFRCNWLNLGVSPRTRRVCEPFNCIKCAMITVHA